MEAELHYYLVEEKDLVVGECDCFVAEEEKMWRDEERYEKAPYQRVAKYTRNIKYSSRNTRTQAALKDCLSYLVETFFPLLVSEEHPAEQYALAVFLEERLKAIRCEYFVQGIINPRELLRIIKACLLVEMCKGEGETKTGDIVGLENLLAVQSQQTMQQNFVGQYEEALAIAILTTQRQGLQKLLNEHPLTMDSLRLNKMLRLRLAIESRNYHSYYGCLEHE